jgi:hypothetical protein
VPVILFVGTLGCWLVALDSAPALLLLPAVPLLVVGLAGVVARVRLLEVLADLIPPPAAENYAATEGRHKTGEPKPSVARHQVSANDRRATAMAAKVRRLVDHGATPGERAAAAEALRRLGARR